MFSSTGVRDCIQSNVCSSSRTSPYAFSQYLQMLWQRGKVGIWFVWPARSLKKKVVTDFASHVYMYPMHSETDFSGYIWENSNSARVTMKKTPPFGNCGKPLTCAFGVAAVSVVTNIAAHVLFKGLYPGLPVCISVAPPLNSCLTSNTKYFLLYNHSNIYLPLCPCWDILLIFYLFFTTSDYLFSAMRLGGLGQIPRTLLRRVVCALHTFPVSWNTEHSRLNSLALGFLSACWISYQISQV